MLETKPVLFSEQKIGTKAIGFIEFNRPQVINSLNLEMVKQSYERLQKWEADSNIAAVFIHSECPKGLCAGGDVKQVALSKLSQPEYAAEFFKYEYLLDEYLHRFDKPVFCWGDGIVMGGGMGVFMASHYRIATENSVFAMPEVAIGFFPDVGASVFLNQIPKKFGWLMGLSGCRIDGPTAFALGIAGQLFSAKTKRKFMTDLLRFPWSENAADNHHQWSTIFSSRPPEFSPDISELLTATELIFSAPTLEIAKARWQMIQLPFLTSAFNQLQAGSAISTQVIWHQLSLGRSWTRPNAAWKEWDLAIHFIQMRSDFQEGVRAMLIDKDKTPKWDKTPLMQSELEGFFLDRADNSVRTFLN